MVRSVCACLCISISPSLPLFLFLSPSLAQHGLLSLFLSEYLLYLLFLKIEFPPPFLCAYGETFL